MECRVGITTNPDRRKAEWKLEHPSLRNWRIEKTYSCKSDAQAEENRLAAARGCKSAPGGGGLEIATWYVYSFEYDEQEDVIDNWWNSDDNKPDRR